MIRQHLQRLDALIRSSLGKANLRDVARDVLRLSDAFTTGRGDLLPRYLDSPESLRAYVSLFLPINAAKVLHCLGEAQALMLISSGDPLKILDVGCGPGTAALAASFFFSERNPGRQLEITGIDRSAAAIAEADRLFHQLKGDRHRFHGETGDVSSERCARLLRGRRFDIIIASNLINELSGAEEGTRLCRTLLEDHLDQDGLLLVVDPALKETARPLMRLRDDLLAACPDIHICAPCLHRGLCPMLAANRRDWCHFYLEWERPETVRELDELIGLDHRYLKMAYLILSRHEARGTRHDKILGRVVSSPLVSKGKRELVLCGSDGILRRIMRQDKDEAETNRDFGLIKRGDVVLSTRQHIGKNDEFRRLRAWQESP